MSAQIRDLSAPSSGKFRDYQAAFTAPLNVLLIKAFTSGDWYAFTNVKTFFA